MKKFVLLSLTIFTLGSLSACKNAETPKKTTDPVRAHRTSAKAATTPAIKMSNDASAQTNLTNTLNQIHFSGTAMIVRHGKIIAHQSNGYAHASTMQSTNLHTMYEIDSIQKASTAILIMKQIQAGKLALNTTLNTFYPQIRGSEHITIRQMLDMTSGLAVTKFKQPAYHSDFQVVQQFIAHIHYTKWNQWNYQPINYVLLCGILESITGKTYQQLFTANIAQPLGLTETRFAYLPQTATMAQGYYWDKEHAQVNTQKPWNATSTMEHYELGTGQIFASVTDLYKLESAIVSGRLIGRRASDVLHWPGSRSTYAGGLYQRFGSMRSQGYGYGYEGFVRITPDGQNAVIMLANVQPNTQRFLKAADQLALVYAK
ncbi:serine hydrolase domain-containing protein [Lacticaseibacillus hulanensis]|jgi:CubicO group peptidase (beta-lactamase class C family)|uniref:serine hydrolase domain-containing protein n=1 Tax=Lacticaseibacillus hulanensis TaxID=2493111 RepID=UPI000FD7EB7D|nr:serine hydrolase domain-containing protein [Lacticaseibacillus hulanensis]